MLDLFGHLFVFLGYLLVVEYEGVVFKDCLVYFVFVEPYGVLHSGYFFVFIFQLVPDILFLLQN